MAYASTVKVLSSKIYSCLDELIRGVAITVGFIDKLPIPLTGKVIVY